MDFASRYMKSKGWSSGDGLGKTLNGRKDPVKVKFKFDINGLGHDRAEVDKYKWWEHAFKTAADAITVGKDNKLERVEGKAGAVVSTSRPMNKALNKALLYGNHFIRKGVMEGGKFTRETESDSDSSDSSSDEDAPTKGKIVDISDEALFAACGGMTGHKGARHGINMSAKMARIEKQERIGLEAMNNVYGKSSPDLPIINEPTEPVKEPEDSVEESIENTSGTGKQKKRKKDKKTKNNIEVETVEEIVEKPKKKKKRKEKVDEPMVEEEVQDENENLPEESKRKSKKRRKKRKEKIDEPVAGDEVQDENETLPEESKKRKRKIKETVDEPVVGEEVQDENDSLVEERKKRKKKKKRPIESIPTPEPTEEEKSIPKKKKSKKRDN